MNKDDRINSVRKAVRGIAAAVAVAAIALWLADRHWFVPTPFAGGASGARLITGGADRLSDHNGRLVVLVYSDFQCPFCKVFALKIEPALRKRFEASGTVVWVHRHMPLDDIHPDARSAASYQVCASRWGLGHEMSAALYSLSGSLGSQLPEMAKRFDLPAESFAACLRSTAASVLEADRSEFEALGLRATPTVVLARPSGRDLVVLQTIEGARPLEVFAELIDAQLPRGSMPEVAYRP